MGRVALVDCGRLVLQDNCGDIKALEPGAIEVDITTCNIYGSDIAFYRGERSPESERCFGHEFSGVVTDPSDGTSGIKKSIRMASELSRVCGYCWNCHNGLPNYCRSMSDALLPGGFSEETLVLNTPEYNFIGPVPGTIDDITTTLLEPANCAYHVARRANVKHGETAVVFGMGPVGLIAARIIKGMGVDVVTGMDSSKAHLEKMQNLGFVDMIDSNSGNWQDQIFGMCGSKGADVIIGLTGALPVLQSAFRVVRLGGRIVVDSVYSGFVDQIGLLLIMRKELTTLGSKGLYPHLKTGGTSAAVDVPVRLQNDLKKLITVYDYKDVLKTFDDVMPGFAIKPVTQFRS